MWKIGRKQKKDNTMTKENVNNEQVSAEAQDVKTPIQDSAEAQCGDNVADNCGSEADNVSVEVEVDYQAEAAEWKDKFVRLQAEFDNYRKRTLREKIELIETGGQDVLKAVLPVMDDVQRAVDAISKSDDMEALRRGVELISQKFTDTLRQRKVTAIEAKGQPFDEELMEAVAKFPAGEEAKGKVIDVVQTGYMLGERVLRFAKVVVGE